MDNPMPTLLVPGLACSPRFYGGPPHPQPTIWEHCAHDPGRGEDNTIPNSLSTEMANGIPGANLAIVPNCGHLSVAEQPSATSGALVEWLRS
jgi:pimeloyl-ACP methyl ester carboxylesterase